MNLAQASQEDIDFLSLADRIDLFTGKIRFWLIPDQQLYEADFRFSLTNLLAVSKGEFSVAAFPGNELIGETEIRNVGIRINSRISFDDNFLSNVDLIMRKTNSALLYSDYRVSNDESENQNLLPSWSPIRFESIDYLGPVLVFDIDQLGALHPVYKDGSRFDLVELLSQNESRISRIPRISYTATENYVVKRTFEIENSFFPDISVIIPTRGLSDGESTSLLERCLASLEKQDYPIDQIEIILVVDSGFDVFVVNRILDKYQGKVSIIEFTEPFNFSAKCNLGASKATTNLLVFLNDDVEFKTVDAISKLVSIATWQKVGCAGAQLRFNDGSIQHAGITLQDAKPRNAYLDQFPRETSFGDLEGIHEVSGVTGALLVIQKTKFDMVGGWSEAFDNSYNDVELCLRLRNYGMSSVIVNDLEIFHHESATRDATFDMLAYQKLKNLCEDQLGSERFLRSPEANGEFEGHWGIYKSTRNDLSGRYFRYALYLLKYHGPFQVIKSLLLRISGQTKDALAVTRHEYL